MKKTYCCWGGRGSEGKLRFGREWGPTPTSGTPLPHCCIR